MSGKARGTAGGGGGGGGRGGRGGRAGDERLVLLEAKVGGVWREGEETQR